MIVEEFEVESFRCLELLFLARDGDINLYYTSKYRAAVSECFGTILCSDCTSAVRTSGLVVSTLYALPLSTDSNARRVLAGANYLTLQLEVPGTKEMVNMAMKPCVCGKCSIHVCSFL